MLANFHPKFDYVCLWEFLTIFRKKNCISSERTRGKNARHVIYECLKNKKRLEGLTIHKLDVICGENLRLPREDSFILSLVPLAFNALLQKKTSCSLELPLMKLSRFKKP